MKLMSWNVRGLGNLEKRGRIRKLIYERKADIVLLQETKNVSILEKEVRALWGKRNMDFMVVGSEGSAGGLLCIWDPDVFRMVDCCCNRRLILLSGKLLNSFDCNILNVYAPNEVSSRGKFWDTLIELKSGFPNPWYKGMMDLNSFIQSCELNDLPLLGKKFIWSNAQDGEKWSGIDRFLLNPKWLMKFNFKEWGLPGLFSDHCPIMLIDDERDWGPKPFRFINAWSSHPSFSLFVAKVWDEFRIIGKAGHVLFQKLKMLKVELKKWNLEVFGNLAIKLKNAEEELVELDIVAENRGLVAAEKARRRQVRGEVWKLSKMVEWLWQQKSRVNWTINGDKNTRFFYIMASSRRSRNSINSITVEG
ncbi:hypothetical protein CsSME_00001633 [Camellia sinensis var. sinensis]